MDSATRPVLLIRPDRNEHDAAALARHAVASTIAPVLEIAATSDPGPAIALAGMLRAAGDGDWLILTSPRTLGHWRALVGDLDGAVTIALGRGLGIATVGPATTDSLPPDWQGQTLTSSGLAAEDLLAELLGRGGRRALIPASARARTVLADGLRAAGWTVSQAAVYSPRPVATPPRALIEQDFGSVVVRSASAADALALLSPAQLDVPVFAVGPITAHRCRAHGWHVIELDATDSTAVADEVASTLAALAPQPTFSQMKES